MIPVEFDRATSGYRHAGEAQFPWPPTRSATGGDALGLPAVQAETVTRAGRLTGYRSENHGFYGLGHSENHRLGHGFYAPADEDDNLDAEVLLKQADALQVGARPAPTHPTFLLPLAELLRPSLPLAGLLPPSPPFSLSLTFSTASFATPL